MGSQGNDFDDVIDQALSRRALLSGGSAAVVAFLLAPGLSHAAGATGRVRPDPASPPLPGVFDFAEVARTTADTVTVPEGYRVQVLYSWGDSIHGLDLPFRGASITADEQVATAGTGHDGMHFFPTFQGADHERGVLVINHEFAETEVLFDADVEAWDARKSATAIAAQGVSVIMIRRESGAWQIVNSAASRRITTATEMRITGPAAGHALMRTSADPTGRTVLGTAANCANGVTPWGTYLTCEENIDDYFGLRPASADTRTEAERARHATYRLGTGEVDVPLYLSEDRFDLALEPNESNRFGWIVEIDPWDPESTPAKRSALGRFNHENAEVVVTDDGHVVVYSGDDDRGQHLYKFVSGRTVDFCLPRGISPLDAGTLYVARFDNGPVDGDARGIGRWIPLTPNTAGLERWTQAEILINTRQAAAAVGATRMDRPEWVAADPNLPGSVLCTLTNSREEDRPAGSTDDANPRTANPNGHIIRWFERDGDHAATEFTFDVFVLAGDPGDPAQSAPDATAAVTEGIVAFSDPDGLWFDGDSNLWIQTDGAQPDGLNNQMLVARPDGGHRDGVTMKRFLVGPLGCEITGITTNADGTSLFVNIQHPGEDGAGSDWPDKVGGLPRSSTVVITRDDGGVVAAPRRRA